jgi:hypothetical protein
MAIVVVDTDVVSFRFKKDTRARLYKRHLLGQQPLIAFMTLAAVCSTLLSARNNCRSCCGSNRRRGH